MNKIYRTVYNESTNTWVAVEETAKSHRKSSGGVVDNATTDVSGSLKVRSLTAIAAALAMVSPFMANQAHAALCQNNTTKILVERNTSCQTGETPITTQQSLWGGGTAGGTNSTAWGVGTANGTNSSAWGSGYAGAADDSTYGATIKVNNPNDSSYKDNDAILTPYIDGSVTYNKSAEGLNATAWGYGNNTVYDGRVGPSVAVGQGSTAWAGGYAVGNFSTAFGAGAFAANANAVAWSRGKAIGADSTAWGRAFATAQNATAWGNSKVLASGNNSTAFGNGTRTSASQSVAWGYQNQATNNNATAFGHSTIASGKQSLTFGQSTQANSANSVAWGNGSIVAGNTYAGSDGKTYVAFKLMEYADSIPKSSKDKQYYIIGIADDENKTETVLYGRESDTAALTKYTGVTFGGAAIDTIERGKFTNWLDNNTATQNAQNSTAFGLNSQVYAQNALGALGGIVGEKGQTYGKNSAAIGEKATVLSDNAYAIGANTTIATEANNSFATTGGVVSAGAENAIAMGDKANATLKDSVALGSGSTTAAGKAVDKASSGMNIGGAAYTTHSWSNPLTDTNKVVSVGDRQIQHIANGQVSETSTDAINGSQLYAAYQDLQWKASVSSDGGTVSGSGEVAEQVIGDYSDSLNKGVVNFKAGTGIKIETANASSLDMTFKVHKEEDGHTATNGKIDGGTADQYWDSVQVANAINASGWKLGSEIINPGDTVNFNGENGITVNATGGNVTIGFNKAIPNYQAGNNVSFQNVTDDEGNVTSTKINARDTIVQAASGNKHLSVDGGDLDANGVRTYSIKSNLKGDGKNITVANDGTVSFTDTTTYTSTVDGLTLNKNGDTVTLGGALPKAPVVDTDGKGGVSVTPTTKNGVTTYTVNGLDTQLTSGNGHITVAPSDPDDNGVRNYVVQSNIKGDGTNISVADNGTISFTDTHSWVASDGSNKTTVNKDKEVVWRGSGSLKVENENGTFTISDKTTYTSDVNGLGLAKTGDEVKLTGVLPTSKVQAGTNITSVGSATDTATGVTTYTVNATGVAHDSANKYIKVTGGDKENFVVNEDGLDNAIKAAKSEVVAGKGGVSIDPVSQNTDGANVYTVNAIDTKINPTGKYTSVAGGEVDENGVRMYTINSTLQSGKDIEIGADGKINYTGTDNDTKTTVTTADSNLKVKPTINDNERKYDIALNKNLDLSDSGSLKTGNTTVNNDGVTVGGVSLTQNGLNNGGNTITNVKAGENPDDAVNVAQMQQSRTKVVAGKNISSVNEQEENGHYTYTIDAYDTKVKAGNGLKLTQNGDTADANNIRTYELALSDENQNAINNAMSGLTTAVDGTTAQTLNNSSNQANFITGDNIQLSGDANGITIATKKDVQFDSVETGSLKADTAELGATTITGDSTYKGSEIVNKTYADSLGWDLKVNGKKQGDRIVNNGSVNFADGQNTTVEYADGAVKVNAKDTQLTEGDYIQLNNGDADANGVRQYTVSAKTTALTTENGKVKTPSGSDLVTADNMANTLNNLYWTAEATEKANVKAGDTVKFQGEKGIAISNSGQMFTITNNAQYESEVAGLTLTKDDTTGDVKLTGNVGDLVDGLEPLKFAGDSGDTLQPKFGDTVKIVGDGQNISVLGKDGQLNVGLNKDVVLGNDSDSGSLKVNGDAGSTAINPNEITFSNNGNINNLATHINPDGTSVSGSNHQAASVQDVLNSGWRIKVGNADAEYVKHNEQVAFIDGKGTSVSGSKAGVAYNINTDPTSQLTINSNNQLTLNTGASSVDAGKAKAKDADSQKIATVGDMVNTINNIYWIATDGQNNTQVKAGDTLTWQGSGSLKVKNENGIFTISDKTTYKSEVDGLGLAKDGDVVKLTGNLPTDTNTVTSVSTADSNLTVTPNTTGNNHSYDIALNKNLDLSDSGSLQVGYTLVNNAGVTAKNITGDTVNATTLHAGDGNVFNVSGSTATYNTTVSGSNGKEVANVDYVNKVQTVVEQGKNTVVTGNKNSNGGMTYTIDAYDTKVKSGNGLKLTQNGDTADDNNVRTYELALSDENQTAINNAMSGLTTAVDGTTAQTLNNSSNQANFITGDNIQLSGNKNGITIATKKDVKFDSVATGSLKANNTETGSLKADTANISTLNAGNHFSIAGDTATYNTTVSGNDGKEVANVEYVQKALPTVKAGTNIVSVDETTEDGHKVYTVNAKGVQAASGNQYVTVSDSGTNFVIDDSALDTAIANISRQASPLQYSSPDRPTTSNSGTPSNDVTLVGADAQQPVAVHNVAEGRYPTDAVNVNQLQQVAGNLNNRMDGISQHSDASAASAIAVASMPQAYLPGKNLVSVGGGTYHGQTGYAIGVSTISDNGSWIFKATATGNSKNRYGGGVGAGFQW